MARPHVMPEQLSFDFSSPTDRLPQLWTVDEIYAALSDQIIKRFVEDRRIERKSARIEDKGLSESIAMFANTQPDGGIILIGVENDGSVSGCAALTPDQLNKIEEADRTYCPNARCQSKRVPVVTVHGAPDFVVAYRVSYRKDRLVENWRGDAFVRSGEKKRRLTEEEKREIRIAKGEIDFELEPCGLRWPDDFEGELVATYCDRFRSYRSLRGGQTNEQILSYSHLGDIERGAFRPNNACALLFAKDVTRLFPGARVRFLRFSGTAEQFGARRNVIKDLESQGCIPQLIEGAERIVESQMRDFTRLGSDGKFYTRPEYPKEAWYEAIVNACVHRSYNLRSMDVFVRMFDDHVVIESPGGFPPPVTPENIYETHSPRNPHLMQAMRYLGYVNAANEGTRRIRESMQKSALPAPIFAQREVGGAQVHVTLKNDVEHRKEFLDATAIQVIGENVFSQLTELEKLIINYLAEHKRIDVSTAQRLTGRGWTSADKVLKKLTNEGILDRVSPLGKVRDPKAHFVLRRSRGGEE